MPRYIIEREVGEVPSDEELAAISRRSIAVAEEMGGIRWIRSYVSAAEGKIYCEYEAPSPERVLEHARRAGLRADRISEITAEINPAMFA